MSVIDDIKARLDITELIGETVKLRKSGRTYMGLCPFHAHKNNTPSFAVWPDSGLWKCFGQCNEGGDVFKFVMKRDNVDFGEALRTLAHRAGVELKPITPEEQAQNDNLDHLRQLLEAAAKYYHHLLKNAPPAAHARAHLEKRGLTAKAIELFELGYALEGWDAGLNYFTSKGYSHQDLLDAGLIVEKESTDTTPHAFDRFRDRLMIPVRDENGRMTGFQARALKPDAAPKFMNSPTTALFDKGRTLFGLGLARKAIREQGAAIVVEGNLDVVAAHQAGFGNVVSSQGTALTEHQLRLLKKYSKKIILALDADEAGDAATLRGLTVAREALDREADFVFDPRGLVKTEGRLGADIRVMTLPEGLDPDEVINQNPGEWRALAEAAEPVVAYVIRVLTTNRDLDDPKTKTQIAETVLPLIEDVGAAVERDTYRQKLARVLKVDERSLTVKRAPVKKPFTPSAASAQSVAESKPVRPAPAASEAAGGPFQTYCLSTLLKRPELIYKVNRYLLDAGLPQFLPDYFSSTEYQMIYRALLEAQEQFDSDTLDHVKERLDAFLIPQVNMLLSDNQDWALSPKLGEQFITRQFDDRRLLEELLNGVLVLMQRVELKARLELQFLIEAAREQGDAETEAAFQQEIRHSGIILDRLNQASVRKSKKDRALLK